MRVGVAIFSYDGACTFGVTGDYDTAPDIDVLCAGIEASLSELLVLAGSGERVLTGGVGSSVRRNRVANLDCRCANLT